jgi:membrane carboxypeptidase/penicillin-binding protein PbpC
LIDINEEYPSFQDGTTYTSENYTLKEYWLLRFKKALWNSMNNSSVRLAKFLWLRKVYEYYISYGFWLDKPPEHYGYSLVLWNPSIRLYDLVLSYIQLVPMLNKNWNVDSNKFLLYDILKDPDNRDISFGVNSILNTSVLQAVKTGTSSNFRDNTLVSYSPDMVIGMWFWNNDSSSMVGVSGITGAGNAWHEIVEYMIRNWYITEKTVKKPHDINIAPYCFDQKCYRKENTYQKIGTKYYSLIWEQLYNNKDIIGFLTDSDIQALADLGFTIK